MNKKSTNLKLNKMKQMKTILNKKLFFLFLLLGTVLSVNAQDNSSTPEVICAGSITHYRVDKGENGGEGTTNSIYAWSVTPVATEVYRGTLTPNLGPNSSSNRIEINWGTSDAGNYVVKVVETNNGCSLTTLLNVTINTTAAPTASAQTFCSGATVANLAASGTGIKWYANSSGGTALLSSDVLVTGTTYYASQTLNSCESTRASALVTINTTAAPTASAQTFCSSATVANLVASGTGIKWYSNSSGGTALLSSDVLVTGTTYYASQTLNSCESTRTSSLVTINTTADPTASAQTFCSGATVADLVASGTGIKWYANSSGGTALLSTDVLVTGTTYYASQTLNSCESTRTSSLVTINTTADPTTSAQTFCSGATVADLVASGTGIKWYANSSGGTALLSTDVLVTGTTYYASQTLNSCESTRASAAVTVNALPSTSAIFHD